MDQKLLNVNNFIKFNLTDNFFGIFFELSNEWCNGDPTMKKNSNSNNKVMKPTIGKDSVIVATSNPQIRIAPCKQKLSVPYTL